MKITLNSFYKHIISQNENIIIAPLNVDFVRLILVMKIVVSFWKNLTLGVNDTFYEHFATCYMQFYSKSLQNIIKFPA